MSNFFTLCSLKEQAKQEGISYLKALESEYSNLLRQHGEDSMEIKYLKEQNIFLKKLLLNKEEK